MINQVESCEYEESAYDVSERLSLLDAVHFLQAAWAEVDDQFVRECWCKFGLKWGALEQPHILSYQ